MKIKGSYGEELTASEWAERLGVEPDLILLCVQAGRSVAEIHALLKQPYKPPKTRKPREGAQMLRTKERMAILLEVSGIADRNEAANDLTVQRVGTHSWHAVHYQGSRLGVYDYKAEALRLSGGQTLPLGLLAWKDAKVLHGADGLWRSHPDTHLLLVQRAINDEDIDSELAEVYNRAQNP